MTTPTTRIKREQDISIEGDILKIESTKFPQYDESSLSNRSFIKNLPKSTLDLIVVNKVMDGTLINFVHTLIAPKNSREGMLYNRMSLEDYTRKVMGTFFVDSLADSINTLPEELDENMIRWIESNFATRKSEKPRWVTFGPDDIPAAVDIKSWTLGPKRKLGRLEKDLLDRYMEALEDEDRYYGDEETDRILDTVGKNDNMEIEHDLVSRLMKTPKRAIKYKDRDVFVSPSRVFGPLNSFVDSECLAGLDGCRMLSCTCHAGEGAGENWFTGFCDICGDKIPNRARALRYPVKTGGWIGQYCNIECELRYDEAEQGAIDELESELMETGIMDRR